MANHIRHGKDKRRDELPEEAGAPRDPSEEDPGGQKKAAAERGAPDQAKPKDKDQYNVTDPQSRIMPGRRWHHSGLQRAGSGRKPPSGR